jgi:hypothetical protein
MEQLQSHTYMRKGFLIYEEMRKYLVIDEEAVIHKCLCNCSIPNFFIYEENCIFFFINADYTVSKSLQMLDSFELATA